MTVPLDRLRACARELLLAAGESEENAAVAANAMARCDARGVATHGTYLLTPIFDRVRRGQMHLPTDARVVQDSGAVAIVDGADGLGQVAATLAAGRAADKARQHGIAAVSIRNTNNVGALAVYTDQVAAQGMVAYMCCNASPAMSPWGGMEMFLGTQPFAFSIHTGCGTPFTADMATSVVARGKIRKAARYGQSIPPGWALDKEGSPTTDPVQALQGVVLPMGGPKGSAIGLAIDIVAGMLSGSSHAPDVKPIHTPSGAAGVGGLLVALDIERFCGLAQFEAEMQAYIQSVKALPKAEGFDEILLPGEIEHRKEQAAKEQGVHLDDQAADALRRLLAEYHCTGTL